MKVALIEFSDSHEECLYSQLLFLKHCGDNQVILVCNEQILSKINFADEFDGIFVIKEPLNLKKLFKIRKHIINSGIEKVVFNTSQSNYVRNFLQLPFPSTIEFSGIIHKIAKLKSSSIYDYIYHRKMKKLIVLNNYLLQNIEEGILKKYKILPSYLIFYPTQDIKEIKKNEEEIWVTIPGQVEVKRRDYDTLFNSLAKIPIPKNLVFIFLGKYGHKHGDEKYFMEKIHETGIQDQVKVWPGYIDPGEFNGYMSKSDYILPLIHPQHKSFELYKKQISGAFNLAFGFKVKLLLHEIFSSYSDFQNNSIFYSNENLTHTIKQLPKPENNGYEDEKWTLEYQARNYINFLKS